MTDMNFGGGLGQGDCNSQQEHTHPKSAGDEALDFLRWHAPRGPWALTSIDLEKKLDGRTFYPDEAPQTRAWIEARNGSANIYFHVNEARKGFAGTKAGKKDIGHIPFLHVDLDPRPGEDLKAEQDRIHDLLTGNLPEGVPPPSAIVFSGGGYQAYWRLKESIAAADGAVAEDHNKRLADALGGDKCQNIDRIMRLPGTINLPDVRKAALGRKAARACLVEANDHAYSLSNFTPSPKSNGTHKPHAGLNIPERLMTIIRYGRILGEKKGKDDTRSAWLYDLICNLLRLGMPEDEIVSIITDPANAISASVLEKADHEKYANTQIAKARLKVAEDEQPEVREMNARHAVIKNYGGRTRVMTDGEVPQFQEVGDFKNGHLNRFIDVGGKVKPLIPWWLMHPLCRRYERVEFLPGQNPGEKVFNLWRGWTVEARAGDCSKFLKFMLDVICAGNATHQAWLLNWMAHAVQKPYEPGEVAVALRGGQGIGKSFFVERFGELFGPHFIPLTDPKHVTSNFNAMLQSAMLVFADEAFAANDKRAEGILKGLVTQSHITIEPKGVNAFKARKFLRIVLASNSGWVISADKDDRRFLVLDVSAAHKRDNGYFAAISTEWQAGGREAFMHYLAIRDISKFDYRARPDTAALIDQKVRSLRGAQRVVYEMLHEGVVAKALKTDGAGRVFVRTQDLHEKLQARCSVTALGRELAHLAGSPSTRENCDGEQRRGFWLLPLAMARAEWSAAVGINPVWPPDDGAWEGVTGESWF